MDSSQVPLYIFYAVLGLFVLGTILSGFFQVMTAEAVVIQRMGKFQRVATAGMNFKLPWLDQIAFTNWRTQSSRFPRTCST